MAENEKANKNESGSNDNYKSQMRLSVLNLAGELPNFIALLISAIGTKTVLVFIDLIDTGSNVMRNILMTMVSRKLRKDLRYSYNYGVGKIEALVSVVCDVVMLLSLGLMLGFAIRDLIVPRPAEGFLLFALIVKILNVCGDVFIFEKQRKLCKSSDGMMFKSAYSVAIKNLLFDIISLTALVLMNIFSTVKLLWYLSPVVSVLLGVFLIYTTVKRIRISITEILDKTADEKTQMAILKVLTSHYDQYAEYKEVRTRISSGTVFVDVELVFDNAVTYEQIKAFADEFTADLKTEIPKISLSLRISGESGSTAERL